MNGGRTNTQDLFDAARSRWAEHLDLLHRLVDIPSHATTPGGTDEVAAEITPLLVELGYAIETVDQAPLPEAMRWVERILIPGQHQEDLGQTYLAVKDNESSTRIQLLGDLDTAYPDTAHRAFPIRVEGDRFYGPGVADMKGGLVVLIGALRALADTGSPHPTLEIVLSADEQAGSLGSRHVIEESASRCKWTLCVECARRGGQLMAARGHIGFGDLTAVGIEAHAGSAYEEGINATDYLARVIPPVNDISRPDEGILVTVTILEAGRRRSVIPDRAWAVLDIRTPSAEDWNQTVSEIEATVADEGEGRVTVRTFAHRPGVQWSADTNQVLDVIRKIGAGLGVEVSAFSSSAAGSSAFSAVAGATVMDGMGPVGGGLMTTDEHVELSSLPQRSAMLASTIIGLGRE